MPPGETSSGRSSVTAPTKPTWTVAEVLDPGRRSSGVGRRCRFILTLAAMYCQLAPPSGLVSASYGAITRFDQVVVALVELVVADGRDLEAGLVERVDRRLVVLR